MDYIYVLENIANRDYDNISNSELLYILCYHIDIECKYPFLQFIMEKIPFCNDLIREQFVLPYITSRDNIVEDVLDSVKQMLVSMGLINCNIDYNMYKGMFFYDNSGYILINISTINVNPLRLSRNSLYWFVLPTEIINIKEVCGFDIDEDVINLFVKNPQISILKNKKTMTYYNVPDVVYTGCDDLKNAEFNAIFGNCKNRCFNSCKEYYYFNRLFESKRTNKFVNRYVLFVEGRLYIETENEFSLTDEIIEKLYLEPCINICYVNNYDLGNPDMLVKNYENFKSLSYYIID